MSDPGASAAAGAEGWNKTREYRSLVDELAEEVSARLQRTIGTSAAAPGLRGDLPPHGQRDES